MVLGSVRKNSRNHQHTLKVELLDLLKQNPDISQKFKFNVSKICIILSKILDLILRGKFVYLMLKVAF